MSSDHQSQIIQCVGCGAKLRVGANASGKTIACPKCSQQLKIQSSAAVQPEKKLVIARPVSSPTAYPAAGVNGPSGSTSGSPLYPSDHSATNWNAPFPVPSANQPYAAPSRASTKNQMWIWIGVGGTAALLFLGVGVAILFAWIGAANATNKPTASSVPSPMPTSPPMAPPAIVPGQPPASAPDRASRLPSARSNVGGNDAPPASRMPSDRTGNRFPELVRGRPFGPNAVLHRVMISRGMQGPLMLNVFMPNGQHASQSLPVVFEAPSGTNLLHGADVGIPRPDTEFLPFTEAGMITVSFSIDGDMPGSVTPQDGLIYFRRLERAYKEFVESEAGVTSGKLAIDYVLDRVAAADPKRLYIWGHSSAATLSLLLAAKDDRIAKCIALAPITDLNERLGELLTDKTMQRALPNLSAYVKSGSPITYVQQLRCPVFLAHAKDDDNEPFKNTEVYVKALRAAGGNITFDELASGGHYQALLDASIPKAVAWLKAN